MTIHLAKTYLGNLTQDTNLKAQVELRQAAGDCFEVMLTAQDQKKARIHTTATCGAAIGIIKNRDHCLAEGDVIETPEHQLVVVHLEAQQLMVLSLADEQPGYALALIHLGHTLGNHHYPIIVTPDKIYIQLKDDFASPEQLLKAFKIPGLIVTYETRPFGESHLPFTALPHH